MDFTSTPTNSIGAPGGETATKVLLLGAGELGRNLTIALANLGLEVHAVDRYEGAPAQQVAYASHVADLHDEEALLDLVARIKPDFVIPEVEHVAVTALSVIEGQGRAVVVPTAKACEATRDRASVRAVAEKIGLPMSPYRTAHSREELADAAAELGFPCIIKPDVTTSGKGHMIARSAEDVEEAWSSVRRVSSDNNRVIVERFVDFDYEVTLLAVRSINPETGELCTWFSEPIGHAHADGDLVEAWQPLAMSPAALENARSVAARISNELGGRGVYCVELFVAGDEIYFSSVSPRPNDSAMVTLATQRYNEFELHARAILGLPIDVTLTSPGASFIVHAEEDAKDVTVSGLAEAMAYPETDVRMFGKTSAYAGRRMGLVLTTAEDISAARDRAALAAGKIVIR